MDSSEFKEGDEIYIKVKATYFYDNYLYYDFTDNLQTYTPSYLFEDYLYEFSTKNIYENGYMIKHYTITKKNLNGKQGKYLIMYFDCEGDVTITNTEKNEGNDKRNAKSNQFN